MTTYVATLIDAETGSEGKYPFEGAEDLFSSTPVRIVRAFMDSLDQGTQRFSHIDYELNVALKNADRNVVTAMGSLLLDGDDATIPFLLMIAPERRSDAAA